MVNFKFAKFHCYQQTQSFLITPYSAVFLTIVDKSLLLNNCSEFLLQKFRVAPPFSLLMSSSQCDAVAFFYLQLELMKHSHVKTSSKYEQ
jgi:hypothetical protein